MAIGHSHADSFNIGLGRGVGAGPECKMTARRTEIGNPFIDFRYFHLRGASNVRNRTCTGCAGVPIAIRGSVDGRTWRDVEANDEAEDEDDDASSDDSGERNDEIMAVRLGYAAMNQGDGLMWYQCTTLRICSKQASKFKLQLAVEPTFDDATLSEISGDIPLAASASSLALPSPPWRPCSPSPDACSRRGVYQTNTSIQASPPPVHLFIMSYVIAGRAIKVSFRFVFFRGISKRGAPLMAERVPVRLHDLEPIHGIEEQRH